MFRTDQQRTFTEYNICIIQTIAGNYYNAKILTGLDKKPQFQWDRVIFENEINNRLTRLTTQSITIYCSLLQS